MTAPLARAVEQDGAPHLGERPAGLGHPGEPLGERVGPPPRQQAEGQPDAARAEDDEGRPGDEGAQCGVGVQGGVVEEPEQAAGEGDQPDQGPQTDDAVDEDGGDGGGPAARLFAAQGDRLDDVAADRAGQEGVKVVADEAEPAGVIGAEREIDGPDEQPPAIEGDEQGDGGDGEGEGEVLPADGAVEDLADAGGGVDPLGGGGGRPADHGGGRQVAIGGLAGGRVPLAGDDPGEEAQAQGVHEDGLPDARIHANLRRESPRTDGPRRGSLSHRPGCSSSGSGISVDSGRAAR